MLDKFKFCLLSFFLILLTSNYGICKNTCALEMKHEDFKQITSGIFRDGFSFKSFQYNNVQLGSGRISTHGNYSATLPKKSFKIKLDHLGPIFRNGGQDRFLLIGLAEDPYHFKNYFSLLFAKEHGLFPSEFRFCEVNINKNFRGLYLLIESPEDALQSEKDAQIIAIARRRFLNQFRIKFTTEKLDKSIIKRFLLDVELIADRKVSQRLKRAFLKSSIALDQYYKFLALNRVLMNGDYTDELFLKIILKNNNPYISSFSGWDYDDIGQGPHNGIPIIYKTGIPSLVYSGESPLDRFIAYDQLLYQNYLKVLDSMNEEIESQLKIKMDITINELKKYKSEQEIKETLIEFERLTTRLATNTQIIRSEILRQKND